MRDAARPGAMVLFGSGENADAGRAALRWLRSTGRAPRRVAVLETPAGFEPNAEDVAGRWASFLGAQAELAEAEMAQVAARRRGTPESPDEPAVVAPILGADLVVLGAGSPTYTVRQLRASLAWEHLRAAHLRGASLFLASAAAIAAGTYALPVYEIYKVGEDPHWKEGLGLFAPYGLRLAVVTHWNNADGGERLDTSRCYMGAARFWSLQALLPAGATIVGIDEHTALAIEPAAAEARVLGQGGVTTIREGLATTWLAGTTIALGELGPFALPDPESTVDPELSRDIERARTNGHARPDAEVAALVASRSRARAERDWATADRLRDAIAERGWDVEDTPTGTRLLARR